VLMGLERLHETRAFARGLLPQALQQARLFEDAVNGIRPAKPTRRRRGMRAGWGQ
jgi:hypothetical protein